MKAFPTPAPETLRWDHGRDQPESRPRQPAQTGQRSFPPGWWLLPATAISLGLWALLIWMMVT